MTKSLLALAAVLAFLAAPVAAHVTVTATGPAEVQAGVPFQVAAEVRANCAAVVGEYQAMGETELHFGLPPASAAYLVAGEASKVPWSISQCSTDPAEQGNAIGKGTFTVTVTPAAPAFTPLNLSVVAYGDDPAVPEGGAPAVVEFRVAYYANGTLAATEAGGHGAMHGNATGHAIALALTYVTNAESVLTVEATSTSGEVAAIAAVPVTPPSFDNKTSAVANVTATFTPPAEWTEAALTFQAFLAPKAGGAKVPVGTARLTLANDAAHAGAHSEHGEHEHTEAKASPEPLFAFVALGLLACASFRRR